MSGDEIDLADIRRVIETVDTARRYVQKCAEMGDVPGEDFPEDYVERAALDSWQGNPPWKSVREESLQARIDAALKVIDAHAEANGHRAIWRTYYTAFMEDVRAALLAPGDAAHPDSKEGGNR